MHGLLEVDGVQHLDLVRLVDDLAVLVLHRLAVFAQLGRAAALSICHSTRMVPSVR